MSSYRRDAVSPMYRAQERCELMAGSLECCNLHYTRSLFFLGPQSKRNTHVIHERGLYLYSATFIAAAQLTIRWCLRGDGTAEHNSHVMMTHQQDSNNHNYKKGHLNYVHWHSFSKGFLTQRSQPSQADTALHKITAVHSGPAHVITLGTPATQKSNAK